MVTQGSSVSSLITEMTVRPSGTANDPFCQGSVKQYSVSCKMLILTGGKKSS